jgi:hypothetical protein
LAEATQLGASHLEANEEGKIFSNKLAWNFVQQLLF